MLVISSSFSSDLPKMRRSGSHAGQVVDLAGAADAVKWFADLWAGGNFDCGPQDYEFMVKETVSLLDVARKLPSSKTPVIGDDVRQSPS
jgi:hypothetical protein